MKRSIKSGQRYVRESELLSMVNEKIPYLLNDDQSLVWQGIGRRGMTPLRNYKMGVHVVRSLSSPSESVPVHGELLRQPMSKKSCVYDGVSLIYAAARD